MIINNLFALANNCSQGVGKNCHVNFPQVGAGESEFKTALSIAFGILGGIAILVMILAAVNMATAGGDAEKIARARKSIIYSLIGIIIAVSAEIIVLTVLGKL